MFLTRELRISMKRLQQRISMNAVEKDQEKTTTENGYKTTIENVYDNTSIENVCN